MLRSRSPSPRLQLIRSQPSHATVRAPFRTRSVQSSVLSHHVSSRSFLCSIITDFHCVKLHVGWLCAGYERVSTEIGGVCACVGVFDAASDEGCELGGFWEDSVPSATGVMRLLEKEKVLGFETARTTKKADAGDAEEVSESRGTKEMRLGDVRKALERRARRTTKKADAGDVEEAPRSRDTRKMGLVDARTTLERRARRTTKLADAAAVFGP